MDVNTQKRLISSEVSFGDLKVDKLYLVVSKYDGKGYTRTFLGYESYNSSTGPRVIGIFINDECDYSECNFRFWEIQEVLILSPARQI